MDYESEPVHPNPQARAEAWQADRELESRPLPGDDVRHYRSNVERQAAIDAAGVANVAKAAGELGMTSAEWNTLRQKLGRSPEARDVQ